MGRGSNFLSNKNLEALHNLEAKTKDLLLKRKGKERALETLCFSSIHLFV